MAGQLVRQKLTHILRLDFSLAFAQRMLDIFILSAFMIPKTFDQVVKRLLEPIPKVRGQPSSCGTLSQRDTNILFISRSWRMIKLQS